MDDKLINNRKELKQVTNPSPFQLFLQSVEQAKVRNAIKELELLGYTVTVTEN